MRVSKIYNATLLAVIARKGKITYNDLKEEYCEPESPGVILGKNVMFDSDLKTLQEEGRIIIVDDMITFIQ